MDATATDRGFGRTKALPLLGMISAFCVAGCSETGGLNLKEVFQSNQAGEEVVARAEADTTLIEREVEAPEVFQATEAGLWDGRPSLGGVWVAHPDVTEPERVMIRNSSNGKFVVGALFRRARETPGPQFQVSSEAADALGMLAGAPAQINVVALRTEAVPIATPESPLAASEVLEDAPAIETATLDPLAGAAAAIEAAAGTEVPATTDANAVASEELLQEQAAVILADAAAGDAPTPAGQDLDKPFVQIGIFSQQDNADQTADTLRGMGIAPTVKTFERDGKTFWRMLVGPAQNVEERNLMLAKIKREGYMDAYPVIN